MELMVLLRQGCRVRHCEWPPFHYAELRRFDDGSEVLCRVRPFGAIEVLGDPLTTLWETDSWSSAGWPHDPMHCAIGLRSNPMGTPKAARR